MPAKRPPESTINPRIFCYSKAQKQQIISAIQLTKDDPEYSVTRAEVLKRATAEVRVYLHVMYADKAAPLPSQLRSQVLKLLDPAQALHDAVQELHDRGPFPFPVEYAAAGCGSLSEVLDRLESDLVCVIRAATLAQLIQARKPHNRALTYFIQELGDLYRETIGHEPRVSWNDSKDRCQGAFFEFVNACLRPTGRPHSEEALCKAICRALQKHRERRQ
jgi:hypothetical protein